MLTCLPWKRDSHSGTIFYTSYILSLYCFYLSLGPSFDLAIEEVFPVPPLGGAFFAGSAFEEKTVS